MVARGYEWGESGLRSFSETYGVLEKVTTIEPADNSCSKAHVTHQIKRRPGASPLLFGDFLMSLAAFVSLEDISTELPPYTEEVIGVPMDAPLPDPIMMLVMRLFTAAAVTDDGVLQTDRASAQDDFRTGLGPIGFEVAMCRRKWDNENRDDGGLCASPAKSSTGKE